MVNVFEREFEVWNQREASTEELELSLTETGKPIFKMRDGLLYTLGSHSQAAEHILNVVTDRELEDFVEEALKASNPYKELRRCMPSKTPKSISNYQRNYTKFDSTQVTADINSIGCKLSSGTTLFHGGSWPKGEIESFTTTRPLSTSFCPQVALNNALCSGKAYDADQVQLFVLRVKNPQSNVFVFRSSGSQLGHEKEVLFASGAVLTLREKSMVRDDFVVNKVEEVTTKLLEKKVPAYVLKLDIS
ncbi:hypothetical protein J6I90_09975 [Pseudidiomarina sp. 1APP75-32.1]|uniref:Uncharacterized protein n=1 Tax=Pseudidiomarina terrestris TaxID=2820060 RepID=A0AAW7R262_9GAMM|nr:hypothetical protein [Pseudidiomarina sp. 1APP75-32.1]MDN7125208.1 hypothetical protein [Pseudidiomarina sp. 1APP75-32.1]